MSLLSKMAAASPKKSTKKGAPEVELDLDDDLQEFLELHRSLKDNKNKLGLVEARIIEAAEDCRVDICQRDGEFHSSVTVNGQVLMSTQNRYSKIPTDCEDELKEAFEDQYDQYFRKSFDVKLTAAALNDEEIIAKLVAAVGEEHFPYYFNVSESIAPTATFHQDRATRPDVKEKAQAMIEAGIIRPAKPSVKPA